MTVVELSLIFILALIQSVTFSLQSRARNRGHFGYHAITAATGNMAWFFCGGYLFSFGYNIAMLVPYILGCTVGSLVGSKLSERIEDVIHATADRPLKDSSP